MMQLYIHCYYSILCMGLALIDLKFTIIITSYSNTLVILVFSLAPGCGGAREGKSDLEYTVFAEFAKAKNLIFCFVHCKK